MILIASGAYLQGDFVTEVGLLPPSFLPIGNKRLYEYQIQFIRQSETGCKDSIYLSIPASYELDSYDEERLTLLGIKTIFVPDGMSIGESINYCWNATGEYHQNLTIIHGDTLFINAIYPRGNVVSVHRNKGYYRRAVLGNPEEELGQIRDAMASEEDLVLSGYFGFSKPLLFMKHLVESHSDFVAAILKYHQFESMSKICTGSWLDFGHINSFYRSRSKMTTQRAFNELTITPYEICKSSKDNPKKIVAEANWYLNLPIRLRKYAPSLIGVTKKRESCHYALEYLYLMPLSDTYVFTRQRIDFWDNVFRSISRMLEDFYEIKPVEEINVLKVEVDKQYYEKTQIRLREYSDVTGVDLDKKYSNELVEDISLTQIAKATSQYIKPADYSDICAVHGDLCFSNILYDPRSETIKCIDPRGIVGGGFESIFGDRRYDLAKLYHSVIGLYDFIIAGKFKIDAADKSMLHIDYECINLSELTKSFNKLIIEPSGYSEKEIMAITIHLFLSMLPLHSDRPDRQAAFVANALRLYAVFNEIS